jgi:hypothetical protein
LWKNGVTEIRINLGSLTKKTETSNSCYLMGVKSEKEPVEGTSPDKLLFERSLFEECEILSSNKKKGNY